ncbi:hypothetical protein V6N12_020154 [Hibiscus sabdariffa]
MEGIIDGLEKKMKKKDEKDTEILRQLKGKATVLLDSPREFEAIAAHTDGQCSASHPVDARNHLKVVAVCLDSKVLNWFQWWEARIPVVTWDTFQVAILQRFTPSQQRNLYEVLLGLQQTKSVAQYREDFELLFAPLKDADEAVLIGIFINGLQEEIKTELSLCKLDSLTQIMDHSQRIEDKNWALSQAQLSKNQRVALPQPPLTFTMVESNRFKNTTSSVMRPTPKTVSPQFEDHKQGKIATSGVGSSTRPGHY